MPDNLPSVEQTLTAYQRDTDMIDLGFMKRLPMLTSNHSVKEIFMELRPVNFYWNGIYAPCQLPNQRHQPTEDRSLCIAASTQFRQNGTA